MPTLNNNELFELLDSEAGRLTSVSYWRHCTACPRRHKACKVLQHPHPCQPRQALRRAGSVPNRHSVCLRWSSAKHRAELYLSQRAFGFVVSSRWPHRCATLIISRAAQPCCDWNVYPQSTSSDFIIFSALHVHCLKSVALIL